MSPLGVGFSQDVRLSQKQTQTLMLTPQMLQYVKFLELNALDLRTELRQQLEQNPAIEEVSEPREVPLSSALPEEHVSGAISENELNFDPTSATAVATLGCDDRDRDSYLSNLENFDLGPDTGTCDEEARSRREVMFDRQVKTETLAEHLERQIPFSSLPKKDYPLARYLVRLVGPGGYLTLDALDENPTDGQRKKSLSPRHLAQRIVSLDEIQMALKKDDIHVSQEKIESSLAVIRQFEPLGCASRTVRECLLAQMPLLDDSPWENEVRTLIDLYLEDVASKRTDFLCRKLSLTPSELEQALATLRTLDPLPGRNFIYSRKEENNIIHPEVFVRRNQEGEWVVTVTKRDLPEIHISKRYLDVLTNPKSSLEARAFAQKRVNSAREVMEAIKNRHETIRLIAQAIVDAQLDVFEKSSLEALKPLTMEQIASTVEVHNTTVSRAVRNKYMATPFGVFELRQFFVNKLSTASGDEISTTQVVRRIEKMIEQEDAANPLSDEKMAQLLQDEGIHVARRTVAKYRMELGLPVASKRLKKNV